MKSLVNGTFLTLFLTQICFAQWFWENPLPAGNDLNDVFMFDSSFGIAVGTFGTILKTSDGGENWTLIPTGRTDEFKGVFLISSTEGFVTGSSGSILKTTDGGENWIPVASGTTNSLNDVFFSDENKGTIVGDMGE